MSVVSYVCQIGRDRYVLAYALQNDMPYASLRNAAGHFVSRVNTACRGGGDGRLPAPVTST